MPLLKTSNTEVERIELSTPGEWVEVKRRMGKDDERREMSNRMRGQTIAPGSEITELDLGALNENAPFARLEAVLRNWNLIDPDTGRVAQVTAANIRALSDEDMGIISARMTELYAPPLSDDDRKN